MSRKKNTAKSPAPANKPAAEAKSAAKPDCSARERLIRGWFSMWLKSDEIEPEDIFADDAVYTESDGNGKICSLREFSAEHERTLPYGD